MVVVAVSVPCRQVLNEEFGFVPIGTLSYFRREMERKSEDRNVRYAYNNKNQECMPKIELLGFQTTEATNK